MPFCKSIHGALNPDTGSAAAARNALRPDTRVLFINATCLFAGSADGVRLACLDGACEFIDSESKFARALDQTDFVDWQQRKPDSPPFSVDLLGGDRKNLFYPDFVVATGSAKNEASPPPPKYSSQPLESITFMCGHRHAQLLSRCPLEIPGPPIICAVSSARPDPGGPWPACMHCPNLTPKAAQISREITT